MPLIDRYLLSRDQTFQQRVEQAAVEAAVQVMREAHETGHHAKRAALAERILREPAPFGVMWASVLASVNAIANAAGAPPIQANVGDAVIAAAVAGTFNDMAGVGA